MDLVRPAIPLLKVNYAALAFPLVLPFTLIPSNLILKETPSPSAINMPLMKLFVCDCCNYKINIV